MYDTKRLKDAAIRVCALNWSRLGSLAHVDPKTAKTVVLTGKGQPDSIYKVALALGFHVKPTDFSAIMREPSERQSWRTA